MKKVKQAVVALALGALLIGGFVASQADNVVDTATHEQEPTVLRR